MLKKIVIGMAGTTAIGISTGALARGSVEQSYNNTSDAGFYVRAEAGYGLVDKKTGNSKDFTGVTLTENSHTNTKKSRGFNGRVAVGYAFNPYFSLESGFTYYHPAYRNVNLARRMALFSSVQAEDRQKINLYSIDLMAKATLPINNFYTFIEGGVAYVHAKFAAFTETGTEVSPLFTSVITPVAIKVPSSSIGYIRPKAGIGVGYNITQNIGVDISYSHVFGQGKINNANYLPNLNAVTVGLTYKF
ncbi:outer membrane protein [Coxiella endosymbiont of Ornithodoros maritimus]|uniref:outer membrane protein n=1 Tax=Coxiella endosymbiont of Ornithodoros maritimus TaxID=1656172 RepID=UPI0022651E2C|nr:outer membrane beta-barrel protein [Coxiella endosymbiont of Ornithodoros maritimus]